MSKFEILENETLRDTSKVICDKEFLVSNRRFRRTIVAHIVGANEKRSRALMLGTKCCCNKADKTLRRCKIFARCEHTHVW